HRGRAQGEARGSHRNGDPPRRSRDRVRARAGRRRGLRAGALPRRRGIGADQSQRLRAQGLEKALASLDPRSRRIVEARWLKEKDTATLHDLAAEYKVSAERIRQIEAKAMEKMRKAMA